jgi:hypothetical protein
MTDYEWILNRETKALGEIIETQQVKRRQLIESLKNPSLRWMERWALEERLQKAHELLLEFQRCHDELQQPLVVPRNFVEVDARLSDVQTSIMRCSQEIAMERRRLPTDDRDDYAEERASVRLFRFCEWRSRLETQRLALLSDYLYEARDWDPKRLAADISRSEDEQLRNLQSSALRLKTFTTEHLFTADPSDTASQFLGAAIMGLRKLVRQPRDENQIVRRAIDEVCTRIDTVIGLESKRDSMKQLYPEGVHLLIDRLFRLQIDKLRERE